jgi:hypothetical protein
MPCNAMHPIQDLFLVDFHMYYNLICNFYMHPYVDKKFHSSKKWVLHSAWPLLQSTIDDSPTDAGTTSSVSNAAT